MDREKVIKGWECHMEADMLGCADCPYREGWRTCNYADTLYKDVYALLKEQDAEWIYGEDETGVDGWHCSYCGFFEPWFYEFTDDIDFIRFYGFCPSCGRRMTSHTGKSTQEDQ